MSPKRFLATTTSRIRVAHHARHERVDERVSVDVGVLGGDLGEDLVPQRHPVAQGVGLRRLVTSLRRAARMLEGEAQDALDPAAGEDGRLDRHLVAWPRWTRPPAPRVSPSVFSRTKRMSTDSARDPASGPCDAGTGARAQVDILVEGLAQGEDEAPA